MADLAAMGRDQRARLLPDLENLSDDQWETMTCCDPWTVKHLVAHMTALGNQTFFNFMRRMITSGFNFDKFTAGDLVKYHELSNADLLEAHRETVENPRNPPGPKYVTLGELMVHSDDIRVALGRTSDNPIEQVVALADEFKKTGNPIGGEPRSAGLRLIATDADWSHGEGPQVAGPAFGLVLAMTGRSRGLDDCTGDGVETMRARG